MNTPEEVKAPESSDDEDEDEDEDEDQSDKVQDGDGDMDVDFNFCSPGEDDYHGLAYLLKGGKTWDFVPNLNFSELTNSVVESAAGTIVKADSGEGDAEAGESEGEQGEEDEDGMICAIATVLRFPQEISWASDIEKLLLAKAKKFADAPTLASLEALLEKSRNSSQLGLLISERMSNLPPQLIPPLHKSLLDDLSKSADKPLAAFTHFLVVVRCRTSEAGSVKGKKKRRQTADASADVSCVLLENNFYFEKAAFYFIFPISGESRMVFCIERKSLAGAIAEIQKQDPSIL